MMLTISKKVFNSVFYPHLFDYDTRTEVYYGGAGSGKSHFVAQKLILKACRCAPRRILIIRKTMASMKDSCFDLIISILSQWKLLPYCNINKSSFTITLFNGSVFLFKGLDDSEKIKSINDISDIWIEEASELSNENEYDQLELRLRGKAKHLQMFLSYNPVSKANWVYRRFHEKQAPNTAVYKSTYKDNRFLPQAYVDKLEAMIDTNPTYYKVYALGEFCSLDRLVFTNWEVKDFEEFEFDECVFGLDFGYINDPSAFVCAKVNTKKKELYIYEEMYQTGMLNDSIARWIMYKGYAKERIFADSAEMKSIEEIKRCGIDRIKPAYKGQGSIMWGINYLQQFHIYVNPRCENMITELSNYSFKKDKKTNEYINEPNDEYNHLCDALRYAIQKITKPNVRIMEKSVFGL